MSDERPSDPLLSDADLMRRWMYAQSCQQHHDKTSGMLLWAKVVDTFCVGSTVAEQACRRHGLDPDMRVRKR